MRRFTSGCIMTLIIMASSLAQSQGSDCRTCCKEVYGTCKEGNLTNCDDRYDKCLEKCLNEGKSLDRRKSGKTVPNVEEPPKTLIPEIPPNPEKMQELKKK